MPLRSQPFEDPAAEASQFLIRLGLAVLAIAIPLSSLWSRRALFILFPLGAGVILVGALIAPRRDALARISATVLTSMGLVTVLLLGWAALSMLWTPFRGDAAERLTKVLGTLALSVAAAAVLPDRTRLANLYLAPVGVGIAALGSLGFGLLEWADKGLTFAVDAPVADRAIGAQALLLWPALGVLMSRQRWSLAVALPVVTTLAVVANGSPVALLALSAGALAFAAALSAPRRTALVLAYGFAALTLLAPLIPYVLRFIVGGQSHLDGPLAPMADWLSIIRADKAKLLTGHGLESAARSVASGHLPAGTPRTAIFDIWYELGVIGAAATAALIFGLFRFAARLHPMAAPAVIGGVVTGLVMASTSAGAIKSSWLTLVAVAGVIFTATVNGLYRTSRPTAPSQSVAPRRPRL